MRFAEERWASQQIQHYFDKGANLEQALIKEETASNLKVYCALIPGLNGTNRPV